MPPRKKINDAVVVEPTKSTVGPASAVPPSADRVLRVPAGMPALDDEEGDPGEDTDDGPSGLDAYKDTARTLTGATADPDDEPPTRTAYVGAGYVAPQRQQVSFLGSDPAPEPVGVPVRMPVLENAENMPRQWQIMVTRVNTEGLLEELGKVAINAPIEVILSKWPKPGQYQLMPVDEHGAPQRKLPVIKHIPDDHAYLQARKAGLVGASPDGSVVQYMPSQTPPGLQDIPAGILRMIEAEREARRDAERSARAVQAASLEQTLKAIRESADARHQADSRIAEEVIVQIGNGYNQIEQARARDQEAVQRAMDAAQKVQQAGLDAQLQASKQNTDVMKDFFAAQSQQMQGFLQMQVNALTESTKLQLAHQETRVKQIEADAKARIDADRAAAERERERMRELADERVRLAEQAAKNSSPLGQLGGIKVLIESMKELGLGGDNGQPESVIVSLVKAALPVIKDVIVRQGGQGQGAPGQQLPQLPPGMQYAQLEDGRIVAVPVGPVNLIEKDEDDEDEPSEEGEAQAAPVLRVVDTPLPPHAPAAPVVNLPADVQFRARKVLRELLKELKGVDSGQWEAAIMAAILANTNDVMAFCKAVTVKAAVIEAAGKDPAFGLRVFAAVRDSGLIPKDIPLE